MFNFDVQHYEKVVNDAIALRKDIEAAADEIHEKGYSNILFIGCGGTYAHTLPLKLMLDTYSEIESFSLIAAEFMAMPPKKFSDKSVCVFSTRSGNTKEIVAAAKFCKEAGATVVMYVSNIGTPACGYADYLFHSFAEDDNLAEAIYLVNLRFVARLMHNAESFADYDAFADGLGELTPYLIKGKEKYEDRCKAMAEHHRDTDYHMVVGSGYIWGEAYDYAMCILEEMQWIKTKSIHAAEFFHGTLELVEKDTSIILFYGEDETRPLMDRVYNFAAKISNEVSLFDTKDIELPVKPEHRKFVAPLVIYTITERLSAHLAHVRNHPLTTRRYYRQMEY
jgi:fructoselysine-6-phosphate deglycase